MKLMLRKLDHRALELELMDDFSNGGEELREALRHIRRLNRVFHAAGPTVFGVRQLWSQAGKPRQLSILDIGAGSGDVNLSLLRWADQQGIDMKITIVDITEEACEEARLYFRKEPRVQISRKDLFELDEDCADIVTGTQFVHHFPETELPTVVNRMLQASTIGVVINDIHRHWFAWSAVWLMTRMISRNRYVMNDGPLSVAKGFRADDWNKLEKSLNTGRMLYKWRPLFRYVCIIWRNDPRGT